MEMERRLKEAAVAGSVITLLELLQEDPLLLDRVMAVASISETPLHIVAMLGHTEFARQILSRKPELARELNSQGSSPLHLASARGHVEIVKEILLKIDHDVCCLLRDQDGRIPLHLAAIKGRVEIVKEFIHAKPDLTREITSQGETILHLCVKYNQFEVFKIVEDDEELLKTKDNEGNAVLHLAAAYRQIQIMKFLLDNNKVEVNDLNANGFTALDVLLQSPAQSGDLLIGETLRSAGVLRAANMSPSSNYQNFLTKNHQIGPSSSQRLKNKKKTKKNKRDDEESDGDLRRDANTLMVVAVLIATMTFEAGLNPPAGGDCIKLSAAANCTTSYFNGTKSNMIFSDRHNFNGSEIWSYITLPGFNYYAFQFVDTIAFLSSLSIIVLIVCGFPFKKRYLKWILIVIMMMAISSVALLFTLWMRANNPNDYVIQGFPAFWLLLLGLLAFLQLVRFVIWFFKKTILRERARR